MSKIYHLQFKEPINNETDYYFGSLSAIYEEFTAENIGCKVERLWNIGVSKGVVYDNKLCSIKLGELKRKKNKDNEDE